MPKSVIEAGFADRIMPLNSKRNCGKPLAKYSFLRDTKMYYLSRIINLLNRAS